MTTFSCLKEKEVINICDGMRLGYVNDLELDECSGRIFKIIVPEYSKCWGIFGHEREFRIPWDCIKRIGDDVVLVDVDLDAVAFNRK